jgi:hypothetical protein
MSGLPRVRRLSGRAVPLVLAALAAVPVGMVFHAQLAGLAPAASLTASILAGTIFAIGGLVALRLVASLAPAWSVIVLAAFVAGAFASTGGMATAPDAIQASLRYPDGTFSDPQSPEPAKLPTGDLQGFSLYPMQAPGRNASGFSADLPTRPRRISLRFAPLPDAAAPASGARAGVATFEVSLLSGDKRILEAKRVEIPAGPGAASSGEVRSFFSGEGIGELRVSLAQDPGSSPAAAFVVQVGYFDLARILLAAGNAMLVGVALSVVVLMLALYAPGPRPRRSVQQWAATLVAALPILSIVVVIFAITAWTMSRTTFAYFWDYRNYWAKTEAMYAFLAAGDWAGAVARFVGAYADDYALLPTVLPALTALLTGYPTRIAYDLTLAVLYAAPAYLSVAWLGKRLLDGGRGRPASASGKGWALSAFAPLATFPVFLTPHLELMPDIGGVALSVAALLLAANMVGEIAGPAIAGAAVGRAGPARMRSSLALGVVLALMFLFRRWFVFEAVGIAACTVVLVCARLLAGSPGGRVALVGRAALAGTTVAFGALALLCWVAFDWSRQLGSHDFANLYASYKSSASGEWRAFSGYFGLAPLALAAGAFVVLVRSRLDRTLAFLAVGSAIVAALVFLRIQSPGAQHYYLLMPALGALAAALAIQLGRSRGILAAATPTLLLLAGGCVATWATPAPGWIQRAFPSYADWLPRHQPHLAGYRAAVQWLLTPENENRKFCLVASSATINQSVFLELWQVMPMLGKDTFRGRMVLLGEVDSRSGPPGPAVRDCELLLVGVPFQFHLSGQQRTMEIIQEDVVSGAGIGAAYARDFRSFPMDNGIQLRAYVRTRDLTDAEYAGLVKRFGGPGAR